MVTADPLRGRRFDTVADLYHQVRPRYPDVIWDRLFEVTGLRSGGRALEIGAGTGIATSELVRRGLHVTAIEPGTTMAAIIDRDLSSSGQVEVRVGALDDYERDGEPFDLVIGATSLHWIDRAVLHERLKDLVRPGGFAAMLYYQHVAGGDMEFFDAAQNCYSQHAPSIPAHRLREPNDAIQAAMVLDELDGFSERHRERWLYEIASDRDHYQSLISTYSNHLSLPDHERTALLACIGDLIANRFGGRIVKQYRYDLVVMQRLRP